MTNKYHLTIRIPFEAYDDIDSRIFAKLFLKKINLEDDVVIKLQRVYDDKAPEKVKL